MFDNHAPHGGEPFREHPVVRTYEPEVAAFGKFLKVAQHKYAEKICAAFGIILFDVIGERVAEIGARKIRRIDQDDVVTVAEKLELRISSHRFRGKRA